MKRKLAITLCAICSAMVFCACGTKMEKESFSDQKTTIEDTSGEQKIIIEDLTEEPKDDSAGGKKAAEKNGQGDAAMLRSGTEVTGTVKGGEDVWYKFTTEATSDTACNITFMNNTTGADDLYAYLCAEDGTVMTDAKASGDGMPGMMKAEALKADTTYLIRLESKATGEISYSLKVDIPDGISPEEETENPENQETAETESGDATVPGDTKEEAMLLPLGVKVFGTADPDAWFAFTTGEAGTTYNITFVNTSIGESYYTENLMAYVCDESETVLKKEMSDFAGTPMTITTNELEANTRYYVHITSYTGRSSLGFSVIVKDPNDKTTAYETAGNFAKSRGGSILEDGEVTAGTCQSTAAIIPLGVKASGTVRNVAWLGFTTGETENDTYNITFETPALSKGRSIEASLYDEYGTKITYGLAHDSGAKGTLSTDQLEANTTYYLCILPGDPAGGLGYSLFVESSEPESENTLVFEVPFEINETQVQFVINQAEFIDIEKAKEVLKPVAEAILEHPDHSILIAGTTATDQTQEFCVGLSNRRADAVKKLLIDTYGVSEAQLKTVGLGYEEDPFERGKDRDSNGNFVESEGKKNRRVVIMDADDPIAKELLEKNK